MANKPVYLMVRDLDDQVGIEWGVDWGLEEDEGLPTDIEELSESQYVVWKFIKVLQGIGDADFAAEMEKQAKQNPSGLLMPPNLKGKPN
jgi:hypothetical protein